MQKINSSKLEWDFSDLLSSDNDAKIANLNEELIKQVEAFETKWASRTDYLEDPKILKEALDDYELLSANYGTTGKVFYYFWLRSHQDQENPDLKARFNKCQDLSVSLENKLQFFTHRLAKIPVSTQKLFIDSLDLADYRHFLKSTFLVSKFLLSEAEEKILNLTSPFSHSNWVKMTEDFISREEMEVLNEDGKRTKTGLSQILTNLRSQNKKVRDSSAKALNAILSKNVDVAEAELNSILGHKKVLDDLRGFKRPDESRHLSEDIESEVVDALIEAVTSKNSISHNFYKLKAKLLGVKKLKYHERNVEYGKINKKYTYEESVNMVGETLFELDPEFYAIFKELVESGRIDVFPRKGKDHGAFCVHILKSDPTYVLLNHTSNLNDVTTLAHEIGHAINNELIKTHQNSLNCDTSLSTAEVASTFMEDFVLEKIYQQADDELKLAINILRLDDAIASITRQVACYKFEQDLHKNFREKGYLSKNEIGQLFSKHMSAYMGEYVEQSKGSENWWVYWSHIRNFFYVYSYASGLLISKSLQSMVRRGDNGSYSKEAVKKVKEFLSAGVSASPKEIFEKLGIDITEKEFWLKGLNEIENLLTETYDLAKKLGKI